MAYTIVRDYIAGIPQLPYRNGVGAYEGVVAHATMSDDHSGGDTPASERAYEASTFNDAFVHLFIGIENGKVVIRQTAPFEYIAWGAGHTANQRFVHAELCMYDDPAMFRMAYDAYVWVIAWLLHRRTLCVTTAKPDGTGTLWSHANVSDFLGGTDHQDPIEALAAHGITWDAFVCAVTEVYKAMDIPSGPFKDVPGNAWCAPFVAELKKDGVLHGDDQGNFRPNDTVTRAEFAAGLRNLKHFLQGK